MWMSGIATSATSSSALERASPRRDRRTISSESSGLVASPMKSRTLRSARARRSAHERLIGGRSAVSGCASAISPSAAQFGDRHERRRERHGPAPLGPGGLRQPGDDRWPYRGCSGTSERSLDTATSRAAARTQERVFDAISITSEAFGSKPAERPFIWHGARADRDRSSTAASCRHPRPTRLDSSNSAAGPVEHATWVPRTKPATESTSRILGVDASACDRVCARCVSASSNVEVVAPHPRARCRDQPRPARCRRR